MHTTYHQLDSHGFSMYGVILERRLSATKVQALLKFSQSRLGSIQKPLYGAVEMVHRLRTFAALAENQSLITIIYILWLTLACNSSSRSSALSWPPLTPALTCTYPHIDMELKINFFKAPVSELPRVSEQDQASPILRLLGVSRVYEGRLACAPKQYLVRMKIQ